eukprot:7382711-Prymnesium_polylepis.1
MAGSQLAQIPTPAIRPRLALLHFHCTLRRIACRSDSDLEANVVEYLGAPRSNAAQAEADRRDNGAQGSHSFSKLELFLQDNSWTDEITLTSTRRNGRATSALSSSRINQLTRYPYTRSVTQSPPHMYLLTLPPAEISLICCPAIFAGHHCSSRPPIQSLGLGLPMCSHLLRFEKRSLPSILPRVMSNPLNGCEPPVLRSVPNASVPNGERRCVPILASRPKLACGRVLNSILRWASG